MIHQMNFFQMILINKRSPKLRVFHVDYFRKLNAELFPFLDIKIYYEANEAHLVVKLQRFQQWFSSYEAFKATNITL